ncbi:transcriptional regulator GutM [Lactiplantibacillus pentosus]
MLIYFGILLVGAFLLQGFLGLHQINSFSRTFHHLRTLAPVAIGKKPKKFRSGTLILIAVNSQGTILEAQMMKGVTIFATFKEIKSLKNQNLAEVAASYSTLREFDKLTRACILDAYKNFINYRTKQLAPSEFDSSIKIWSLPMVEKAKSIFYKLTMARRHKQMND